MKLKKIKTISDVRKFVEDKETNKARELAWSQGMNKLAKVEAEKKGIEKMPEDLVINSTKSANTTHTQTNLVAMVERIDHDHIDHEARIQDLEQKIIWLEVSVKSLMARPADDFEACRHSYFDNKNSCAACGWGELECKGEES